MTAANRAGETARGWTESCVSIGYSRRGYGPFHRFLKVYLAQPNPGAGGKRSRGRARTLRATRQYQLWVDSVEKLRSKDAVFAIGMTRMHVARSHDWCRLRCGDQLRQFPEVLGGGG